MLPTAVLSGIAPPPGSPPEELCRGHCHMWVWPGRSPSLPIRKIYQLQTNSEILSQNRTTQKKIISLFRNSSITLCPSPFSVSVSISVCLSFSVCLCVGHPCTSVHSFLRFSSAATSYMLLRGRSIPSGWRRCWHYGYTDLCSKGLIQNLPEPHRDVPRKGRGAVWIPSGTKQLVQRGQWCHWH